MTEELREIYVNDYVQLGISDSRVFKTKEEAEEKALCGLNKTLKFREVPQLYCEACDILEAEEIFECGNCGEDYCNVCQEDHSCIELEPEDDGPRGTWE